jgi:hypothetical protein
MSAKASIYDLVGDLVLYRNLDPADSRVPGFSEAWAEMGFTGPTRPRKQDTAFAQALAWFLRRGRALEAPETELAEIVYLGDTAMADSNAFRNLRNVSGWQGGAFIGAERDEELTVSIQDGVYVANRWSALAEFISWLAQNGAALDKHTAVIVDIDKTILGARGRNDASIDRARVFAVEATAAAALGPGFDQAAFRRAYTELNAAKYHPFTADNQDYLAYVCLMISARFTTLDALLADVAAGRLRTTGDFMNRVAAERDRLNDPAVAALHDDIYGRVLAGDPTPFKAFRQREYVETVRRMGQLPDDAPMAQRLREEVCLTQEVLEAARWLRRRGCLLMAVSDKPDEAAMPTADLSADGWLPLHCVPTHVVGQSIAGLLPEG